MTVLPAAARARMLSRARAALAAGVATRPIPSRAPSAFRWAAAAGLACVAAVAAGAAVYGVVVRARPVAPPGAAALPAESPAPHWSAGDDVIANLLPLPVLDPEAGPHRSGRCSRGVASSPAGAGGRGTRGLSPGAPTGRRTRPSLQDGAAGGRKRGAARQGLGRSWPSRSGASRSLRFRNEFPAQPTSADRQRAARFDALMREVSSVRWYLAGLFLLGPMTTFLGTTARAASQTFVTLEYEVDPGVNGCPAAAEFRSTVERQLGYDPFRSAADRRVAVQIGRKGTSFDGRIRWSDDRGRWVGDRRLASRRQDCRRYRDKSGFLGGRADTAHRDACAVHAGAAPAGAALPAMRRSRRRYRFNLRSLFRRHRARQPRRQRRNRSRRNKRDR